MKLVLGVVLAAVLAVGAVWAVDVTVPVDTSKAVLQIPVQTKFQAADGVWWEVTGTLTARPVKAPQVTGFLDHDGNRIGGDRDGKAVGYGVAGKPAAILGEAFGALPGRVVWGAVTPCEVLAWEDATIRFRVPPGAEAVFAGVDAKGQPYRNVQRALLTVQRADGQWCSTLAFERRSE